MKFFYFPRSFSSRETSRSIDLLQFLSQDRKNKPKKPRQAKPSRGDWRSFSSNSMTNQQQFSLLEKACALTIHIFIQKIYIGFQEISGKVRQKQWRLPTLYDG
ncbi:hypothetical protein VIN13_3306 [Saccharomyces cerevisiae Vin13]|nr:hypothetical protein VIN13_3306 [Saccharomyces cerevisiae Vin13]